LKAAAFEYVKPHSVAQVIELLQRHGDDARVLAGGQTLMATLNMRLSEPSLLIDITGLAGLRGIELRGDALRIGALTTHTQIEESDLVARHAPLLKQAAPHIAHRAIRNSGTLGGSIAYADPAAEWPACLLASGGDVIVQGPRGERRIAGDDFFTGLYTTAMEPDEIVIASDIPVARPDQWQGLMELARRHGDYAIVGLAATAQRQGPVLASVRLAFMGVSATPWRARRTETVLEGQVPDDATLARADASLRAEIDPLPDLTNSPETKRHLAEVLLRRLLASARH
jgi:aerobic carbon-monoxide dehydrogenase medium subunit